jgi:hypothetical protein
MKDKRSMHLKVQELCDCFATTDPLGEMARVEKEPDKEEGALKWVALAVLHGINDNAKKITLSRGKDGKIYVDAKYRRSELPSPGSEVGGKVFEVVKGITHMEGEGGKTPLALGIRDSSIEVKIKVESKGDAESVTIKFPKG